MSERNKVVWSEGLFLRPQHFQQQDRYLEHFVEARSGALARHSWGCLELDIDHDLLAIGKVALQRCRGVFPDGTPFSMPDQDAVPTPLEVGMDVRDKRVYLALPIRRAGALDVARPADGEAITRYAVREWELRDDTRESSELAQIEVATVRARLVLEGAPIEDFVCIPIARIRESRPDRQVMLDARFMPTVLDVAACVPLLGLGVDLLAMIKQRADQLAELVGGSNTGSVAQIADLLRLHVLNRLEPVLRHLGNVKPVHPEELYQHLISLAGELSTVSPGNRRTPLFPGYLHQDLTSTFEPVVLAVKRYLSDDSVSNVVSIPVELRQPNLYLARVLDSSLFDRAIFVLAAKAAMPSETLRRRFPDLTTVSPAGLLKGYVDGHLPGIGLEALTTVPSRIPFHAGFTYFELDRTHESWSKLKASGALGIFVREGFEGLSLELWALRN